MSLDAMNEIDLNSFERSIASDIKGLKPKAKRKGYAKELVQKLSSEIESALQSGCSFEEIAGQIKNNGVKISPATLKRYHSANKNARHKIQKVKNNEEVNEKADYSAISQVERVKAEKNFNKLKNKIKPDSKQTSSALSGASLTDADYLDDFNDY